MSPSHIQIWAIIRRYFSVMIYYPVRSLLRALIWPLLLIGPALYLFSQTEPGAYGFDKFVMFTPATIKFATLPHLYSISGSLVSDKSTNMKSLMLSMGLGRLNYYGAMSLCFNILVLPIVLIIMIVTKIYLLDASVDLITILALSIIFSLHLDSLMVFAVSFITSSSYSFILPTLVFLVEPFLEPLAGIMLRALGSQWKPFLLSCFSFSPYQVITLFFNKYGSDHHQDTYNDALTQPIYLLFAASMFWIIFFRLFAYWFEEVCPWQRVSAVRPFLFCLRRRNRRNVEDIAQEIPSSNQKYFEARANENRDVGIQVSHVTKTFNKVAAVNGLSFSIYRGETTLLLGHNGAGKSTLMNIILGLLEPDDGFVRFTKRGGRDSPAIGVCPQTSIFDNDLTVKQHFELFNDIKSNISRNERTLHIKQTLNDVSLASHASKRPQELSGGMLRKLSLGIAFVGKSDVLILDEPSSGLDPDSRTFVWNAIRRYRSDRTVLLSTQHMEEADYLGDRIAIMSAGRIICCGSSVYLNKLFGTGYKLRIECNLSKRNQILDYITQNYFDAAQPVEVGGDFRKQSNSDAIVDLTLELKLKDKNRDSELELVRLLEDLENNSRNLSIKSYGLKSSSIEDVMLNTSKYFASIEPQDNSQENSISERISTLIGIRNKFFVSAVDLIRAILVKHIQVHYANWPSVLFLKIIFPILGTVLILKNLTSGSMMFWQMPGVVLITSHLIYYPVKERASKFKIMQSMSNSTMLIYWFAQFLFDIIWVVIPLISIMVSTSYYVIYHKSSLFTIHILVLTATTGFYIASTAFCYCLSNVISNSKSSIGYMIIISSISLGSALIVYIIRISLLHQGGEWIQTILEYIGLLLLPSDAYSYFFKGLLDKCHISESSECTEKNGLSPVIIAFAALIVQTIAYFSLLILIEAQKIDLEWYFRLKNILWCIRSDTSDFGENRQIDPDVVVETTKALTAIKDVSSPNALVAAQLNKSYVRSTNIIENLSFAVNRGECFGLLGVNGAGKTTTFSMLATEFPPDSGRILANSFYSDENLHKYRRNFGYDPQLTQELSLTPYQALTLMARLRGIDELSVPTAVESVLHLLEMSQHAHKSDSKLSGGTKRKLALGMALIGSAAILALDEPTAGVDPFARRGIWRLLKSLRTRNESSIIISSHAMEECEAICDRIAIMARGRLRCIGTFLHLRSKFAKGCSLRVQFSKVTDIPDSKKSRDGRRESNSSLADTDKLVEELQQQISATVGPSTFVLADRNVNSVTFNITDNRVRRSILFRMMRDFRQRYPTVTYMINDSSLEDIFISLAREQQQLEQAHITMG